MIKYVVVDIDDTIAVWEDNKNVLFFKPITQTIDLIKQLNVNIIFITARHEKYRHETYNWLNKFFPYHKYILKMCPNYDMRESDLVKIELLNDVKTLHNYSDLNTTNTIMFEDKKQNVDMWRANGFITYQVAVGYDE